MGKNQDIHWNPILETLPQESTQALERNLDHILASITMLELNISDVKEFV